jgi:hypothetical protein
MSNVRSFSKLIKSELLWDHLKVNPHEIDLSQSSTPGMYRGLQQRIWSGVWCADNFAVLALRALSWRMMSNVLSNKGVTSWSSELEEQEKVYNEKKRKALPSVTQAIDPLSAAASEDGNKEWDEYYKKCELVRFIRGDLERLYMDGVEQEYFQDPRRSEMILNVLLVWTEDHPETSYRQGMHEVAAVLLFVCEAETESLQQLQNDHASEFSLEPAAVKNLASALSETSGIEARVSTLFQRLLRDAELLYSPVPRLDGQPEVVRYCNQIQNDRLRAIDPHLADFLDENFIAPQLYGLRWIRLLFAREFQLESSALLRVWDHIFASFVDDIDGIGTESISPPVQPVEPSGEFLQVDGTDLAEAAERSSSGQNSILIRNPRSDPMRSSSADNALSDHCRSSGYCNLLSCIGDIVLSMLFNVRDSLFSCDSSQALSLLMHYPPIEEVSTILVSERTCNIRFPCS